MFYIKKKFYESKNKKSMSKITYILTINDGSDSSIALLKSGKIISNILIFLIFFLIYNIQNYPFGG